MEIIGTGIDIVEVKRLKQSIKKWGDLFLNRVFTDKEIAYAKSKRFVYEHLAGRFAAKEAVIKAAGGGKFAFKDIEVANNQTGKPLISLAKNNKKYKISVSISHIKDYAVASAIITKKG
ncbi:MAG: holo-ACP synthase [Candidatus Omnitrophota bacterium]|nr:holo-ACP synthase [Candidatus Omnitrophota bacterium]